MDEVFSHPTEWIHKISRTELATAFSRNFEPVRKDVGSSEETDFAGVAAKDFSGKGRSFVCRE